MYSNVSNKIILNFFYFMLSGQFFFLLDAQNSLWAFSLGLGGGG